MLLQQLQLPSQLQGSGVPLSLDAKRDAISALISQAGVRPLDSSGGALAPSRKRPRSDGQPAGQGKPAAGLQPSECPAPAEGSRDFRCLQCGKTFGQSSNLRSHVKMVHQGVKPHTCDVCGKSFGYSNDLRKHRAAVHDCVRNFKCAECGQGFGQAGNMRTHVRLVHKGTKFRCARCGLATALAARVIEERQAAGKSTDPSTMECAVCFSNYNEIPDTAAPAGPKLKPIQRIIIRPNQTSPPPTGAGVKTVEGGGSAAAALIEPSATAVMANDPAAALSTAAIDQQASAAANVHEA